MVFRSAEIVPVYTIASPAWTLPNVTLLPLTAPVMLPEVAHAAHLSFTLLVLALGFVVAALADGFLADDLSRLVPSSTGVWQLLAIAVLTTLVAAAVTPEGDIHATAEYRRMLAVELSRIALAEAAARSAAPGSGRGAA